jgi:formate-dependent nitrite reductase membrane component NrfD
MALTASYIITGIAIILLVIYGADVAVTYSSDAQQGFLPLDDMQRGIGLGGPALILPIIAFFISLKSPSKGLGGMIIIAGILILVGGFAVIGNSSGESERDPMTSSIMLFAPGIIQIILGGIKIKKS